MRPARAWLSALRVPRMTEHHRFLLRLHLEHLTHLETLIGQLDQRIHQEMEKDRPPEPPGQGGASASTPLPSGPSSAPSVARPAGSGEAEANPSREPLAGGTRLPLWSALWLLTTIPGISRRTAEVVLAEIGCDMSWFATSGQLASWAGLCPGNNESAGQRRSGRTVHGDRWLRSALVQAAWAASRARKTYLAAQYRRLARRRGKKKALLAVAHTLLVMCYQVLRKGQPYQELGPEYLNQWGPERRTRQLVRQLESLGHKVTLEPKAVG
jgi:transposase